TSSSGAAMPKTERKINSSHGDSVMLSIGANGARINPSSDMLAAPSTNAAQTIAGGPGRSSAAITSQSSSSAGAMAAAPMTVGRVSSRFMPTQLNRSQ